MNTMHFMKALGEIPEELVRCYFDGMPATTKAPEHVQYKPTVQCRSATQKSDRYASRILAGAVVAACLLFAVGFGVFLPRGMHEHTPVQSAPPASASQPATEPISQAEVSGTRTVPDAMTKDGIRELMLNSTDYYNTVSGEFYYTINDDGDLFILSLECDIDASTAETHVMQVYPTNMEAVKAEAKPVFDTDKVLWSRTQIADGTMWTLTNDLTGETLETGSVITRDQLTHEPLEKRFHINPDGTSSSVQRADPTNTYFARRILTPEELTFSLLCSTDEWDITGTTLYAGRQCAVVSGTAPASYSEKNQVAAYTMYVDNQTGILMRFVGLNAAQKIVKFIYTKQIDISPASAIQSATEPASQTEISGTDAQTTDTVYAELELHEPEKRTVTWKEQDKILNEAYMKYAQSGPAVIDTQTYIRKYFSPDAEGDWNSLEAKSYLYHMMLNSIDYFRSAEGAMTYGLDKGKLELSFQTDRETGLSYESERHPGFAGSEMYYSAKKHIRYTVDLLKEQYIQTKCADEIDFRMSDNERYMMLKDGTGISNRRNDPTGLGISGNSCLFPQNYAMSRLCSFDQWHVTGTERRLDCQCAVIEGTIGGRAFQMMIDTATGIMLRYEEFYENGNQKDLMEVSALKVDQDIAVKQFDPNLFALH